MFRWFRDRIENHKLDRWRKALYKGAAQARQQSKDKNDPSIEAEWHATNDEYYRHIEWYRQQIVSDSLIKEADQLHVRWPSYGETGRWRDDHPVGIFDGGMALTTEAMADLRSAIRNERRERREIWEWALKIIGGIIAILTGLVGALIGLISVLRHK